MSDSVEHPSHYNAGGIETIDAIKSALGDAFLDYCRGNVLKYVWRCRHKGRLIEDLRKASKYLEWAIAEAEGQIAEPTKPGHVEGVWVEEADANASKIEPTETSDASIPDPGPGYRLLSKDPPEPVVKGDEFWQGFNMKWVESENFMDEGCHQYHAFYYRRKIEPTEWIPKVGDRVRVRCFGRIADGKIGVVVEDYPGDYAVRIVGEDFKSCNLKAEHLELIEAAS